VIQKDIKHDFNDAEPEEWKQTSLKDRLRRRHIEAPLPEISESTIVHNRLANMPMHDFSMPKKKDSLKQNFMAGAEMPDDNALRIAPDYK